MLWHSEQKLSALQRWILIEAYSKIVEAGSSEPKKYRRTGYLPPVHLLRIKVLRDYFNIPLRTQRNDYGHKWLVIDNATAGPERANAARTSLSRSLRRLKERGLISDSIRLTLRGIDIAKELSEKWYADFDRPTIDLTDGDARKHAQNAAGTKGF